MLGAISAAASLIGESDSELLEIVALSVRVSLTASIVALAVGAPVGAWLAIARFPGRQPLIIFANALLGLPPVVVGLGLYLFLSRSGPLGTAGLLFTPTAMVIAQTLLATPIVVALVHRASTLFWAEYGDLARTDGLSVLRSVALLFALGRASLLTAFLAAFGRAIAEVGAIIIVGGNIHGFTRTRRRDSARNQQGRPSAGARARVDPADAERGCLDRRASAGGPRRRKIGARC
ncbi:tungstate transport system permease protein [Bradyrhizobium sp. LB8.2]